MNGNGQLRPFNRYPLGLLGLLDAKVRGQTPAELTSYTQATVDISQFLLAQSAEVLVDDTIAIVANANFGANGTLTVPQDEVWYVHGYTVRSQTNLAAGTTVRFQPLYRTTLAQGTATAGLFAIGDRVTATVGERPAAGNVQPFLMAPGDQLGLLVAELVVGTAPLMTLFAKVSRLRV